jgi:hypothetical protein
MALSDAGVIALLRAMYPEITSGVASDAYLEVWLPWARRLEDPIEWGTAYDDGIAMLLAHRVQSSLIPGGNAPGPIKSISTLQMSASFDSAIREGSGALSRQLATTPAGRDWLAARAVLPGYVLPRVVTR